MASVDSPGDGGHGPSQEAADAVRQVAGTDGAFISAGMVKGTYDKANLASLLKYPTETIAVVNLTGAQIKQAFELSVSLYPQPNESFLQVSGFQITFNKIAPPNSRVVSVLVNGAKLEDTHVYSIAMPTSLARGSTGFFKIWDKSKIARTVEGQTMEDILKGKAYVGSPSRWLPQ